MLADVETNETLPADELQLCPSEFGPVAIFPMSATRRRDRGDRRASRKATRRRWTWCRRSSRERAPAGHRGACPALEQLLSHPSSPRRASCASGRMFIAGDAAHIHSPVWRPGDEHRTARRLEPGLEARPRAARPRQRGAARQLRRRAPAGDQAASSRPRIS